MGRRKVVRHKKVVRRVRRQQAREGQHMMRGGHMMSDEEMQRMMAGGGMMRSKRAKKGKNWIQGAIKHPGALRRTAGVKAGRKIPRTTRRLPRRGA